MLCNLAIYMVNSHSYNHVKTGKIKSTTAKGVCDSSQTLLPALEYGGNFNLQYGSIRP